MNEGPVSNGRGTDSDAALGLKAEVLDTLEAAVYLVDLDGRIRVWNRAAERILGFTAEEAIGSTVPELGFAPPAEVAAMRSRVVAALERRVPPDGPRARPIEVLGLRRRRDGTLFPTRAEVNVLRDAQGAPTGVLAMLHDLGRSPNRLADPGSETMSVLTSLGRDAIAGATPDELLAMAVHRLAAAFSVDYVASWRYDARVGEIRLEAGYGWSGRSPAAPLGSPAAWLMLPDTPMVFNGGPLQEASNNGEGDEPGGFSGAGIRSGAVAPVPGHGRHAGGIAVYSREPRDFSGFELEVLETVAELVGAARARVRMVRVDGELDIARRQASIGALISGVAHDFNNMLAVMLGYARLLQNDDDPELRHEGLTEIQIAAERAIGISRSLVDLGRPARTEPEVLAVGPIVAEVGALLGRTLGEEIEVELDIDAPDAAVLIAPGELDRAIVNLVANSRDAMPDGGTIRIRVRIERSGGNGGAAEQVLIEVIDEGTGMSAEVLARAPELSFTTKARGEGSGIGLAAVSTIVRAAGGELSLSSAEGEGTTASIRLPLAVSPPV